jgi:hypothetical protein
MADKRMFTKEITESDDFLDLPHSARCLYYDLNLNADDDGFINSPNKVMRISGASKTDLEALINNRFVLSFPGNVICIKHWQMHNTLKKDRYKPTKYQEYRAELEVKDNGAYTEKRSTNELEPNWNQNGNELEPQYSIDKYSLVENSVVEVSIEGDHGDTDDQLKIFKGSVLLSDKQVEYLLEKMGLEAFDEYVDRLNNWLNKPDVYVKSHYETILKWYNADRQT